MNKHINIYVIVYIKMAIDVQADVYVCMCGRPNFMSGSK